MGYDPSDLATNGCVAYDYSLQQEVLFMTIPLCLLADSPMAAEFTNTPIPGSSNNPCRMCHLQCPQGDVRSTLTYMKIFLDIPNSQNAENGVKQSAEPKNYGKFLKKKLRMNLKGNIKNMGSGTK